MSKKWIIGIILLVGLIGGVLIGIFAFGKDDVSETNIVRNEKLASVNEVNETVLDGNIIATSSAENDKISPNAVMIQKRYYKKCDHLLKEIIDVPESLVNRSEEDLKEAYVGWKLEGFSPTEIVLYQEIDSICKEHYLVKEHNGVIGIYTLDEYDQETLQEDTEIVTQYLPEEDLAELKIGVKLVGTTSLYNFLENYE